MDTQQNTVNSQIDDAIRRIDDIIKDNRKYVWIVVCMTIGIFMLGCVLIILGFESGDWRVLTPSIIVTAFLYWPINKIIKIRKENISLAVVPSLVKTLPPEKAAEEIVKLIKKLNID